MAEEFETIVRVRVSVRVQGVGYRAWTVREASRRRLRGFVRNRSSGEVEAVFAGAAAEVEAMIESCRRGPHHARVAHVAIEAADAAALVSEAASAFAELHTV